MITRGTLVNEYVPGYEALMIDSYVNRMAESMGMKLVTVKTSKKGKEADIIRSGTGPMVEKPEGTGVTFSNLIGGPEQVYIPVVWALGLRFSEESIDDNLYELNGGGEGNMKEPYNDLGVSVADNVETKLARFFNSGTATTYHTTRFSKALFATDHPRLDGSTYQNYATNADTTYLVYWALLASAENQYDHRQMRIQKKVKGVWAPPQREREYREILYSPDRPDTGNRAISALAQSGRKVTLNIWSYMTDTDMSVLQLDGTAIKFFWNRKTRFAREGDFQTGDMMIKVDQRWSAEICNEQCFYGNIPA